MDDRKSMNYQDDGTWALDVSRVKNRLIGHTRIHFSYKYPREIEFQRELHKTVSGKIRRVELRQKPE